MPARTELGYTSHCSERKVQHEGCLMACTSHLRESIPSDGGSNGRRRHLRCLQLVPGRDVLDRIRWAILEASS